MKQKIMYREGLYLSYAEYGDKNGYPLLIQHGLIASIDDDGLFDRLIQLKARLICLARPGYGDSSPYEMNSFAEWAEIVAPLISTLNLAQFDVLGMSSGAPYSYALGYGFPDKARHIYIFSGMPALYDPLVRSAWPYDMAKNTSMAAMENLAHELFFSNLTAANLQQNDLRDSMRNNGFGVAQDLKLRAMAWGFSLAEVKQNVFMRHSQADEAIPFSTAVRTAALLPHCHLELKATGPHFSVEALDDFIKETVVKHVKTKESLV